MKLLDKKAIRQSWKSPERVFCLVSLAALAVLGLCILLSRGEVIQQYFFFDTRDTGMDFFHSIEYVRGRMPYGMYDTLYPPLANLFFYLLYLLVPKELSAQWADSFLASVNMRGTSQDLRSYQSTMLLFLLFVMFTVFAMYAIMEKMLTGTVAHKKALVFCALFSYGVLYGVERGNIILLCWVLMAFFLCYRNDDNAVLRELACLALAAAAGMKLYPAFLGILLLKDRRIFAAIRTILYGVASVVLPLYLFNEGLLGLRMWLNVVFSFQGGSSYPWVGNGFSSIMANLGHMADAVLGTSLANQSYTVFGIAVALLLLVCACLLQKEWESVLTLVLAMMMFQAQSDYIYCLFLLPLLLFIAQEGQLNRNNLLPFAVMVLFTVHLPLFHGTRGTMLLVRNLFFQALFVVLLVWCVVRAWKSVPRKQTLRSWRLQAFGLWEKRATVLLAVLVVVANVAGLQIWERTHNWGFDYGLNTGIDERDNKQFTLRDQTTGEDRQVVWCAQGSYFIVYNHAPFEQNIHISFTTGYRMDLSQAHSIYFVVNGTSFRVVPDEETGQVECDMTVKPGETKVELSYVGPRVVTTDREGEELKMTFTVADFKVEAVQPAQ